MSVCLKCGVEFPKRIRIDGVVRNMQRRRFCLDCSPFGSHNTRNLTQARTPGMHRCPACTELLPLSEFYRRRKGTAPSVYCKACTNKQVVERQQALKRQAVAYKGGRCLHCGYDRYIGSLEFHHLDSEAKELNISHSRCTSFEKIRPELEKCVLLCANCHREEHARQKGLLGDVA